jgi:hypothetical protein
VTGTEGEERGPGHRGGVGHEEKQNESDEASPP